jgi:hypothetical protein
MTIKALYPTVRPTLNLDFAKTKALDPRVTYTRASTATFVGSNGLIQTAASGAARFDHNPATGESLGLLVEEARTNRVTYSEQFDNAGWTKVDTTVTANATVAPDGTSTADKLVETAAIDQHRLQQVITVTANTVYTTSLFAKASERSRLRFGLFNSTITSGAYAEFNLSTGTISGQTTAGTATNVVYSIVSLSNGFYRCSVSSTVDNSSTSITPLIGLLDASGSPSYTGDGTSGIYIWGAQLEAGAFPTSYIPTTSATVTRAADVASITGASFSSWFNGNKKGTLFFNHDLTPETQYASNTNSMIVAFADSIFSYGNVIGYWGSGTARFLATNNYSATPAEAYNSGNFPAYGVTLSNPGYDKYALAYTPGSGLSKAAINGVLLPAIDTPSAYIPTGLFFGGTHTQRIARLAFYPVRLPDAQLQAITAT